MTQKRFTRSVEEKKKRGRSAGKKSNLPRFPNFRASRETQLILRRSDSPLLAQLRDVHSEKDGRKLDLERAGVKGLRYPICVLDRANGQQHTIAEIDMSVSLPHRRRGAHMSRFVELLNRHRREIDIRRFRALCAELRSDHDASAAHVTVRFPYFIEKRAPVSGAEGLVDYSCTYGASVTADAAELWVAAEVPVTSLCPCSKAISRHGAHNQRSIVHVKVWFSRFFWLEDLIALVEESASCDLYALLKRPDEKWVTERAYQRPRFVEDLVREVGTRLRRDRRFTRWEVEAESLESIHAHSAYARLSYPAPAGGGSAGES
jgi:GTP cyclohydrolase I